MSDRKFGLIIPQKTDKFKMRPNSIFGDDSDEDEKQRKRPKIPQKKIEIKKKSDKDSTEDPSIYEYDSIYDDMKAKQAESIAPKVKKSSRYIDTLLKAADKRKKEYERRIDKKIQAEREKEGDLYKDKEAFVTSSYKKKLQEKEEEEERERRENMLNDMMDVTKQKDLTGFYRHFLKQTVGEEKIPIFGEKRIKQEETAIKESESSNRANVGKEKNPVYSQKHIKQEQEESNSPSSINENIKNVNLDHTSLDQDSDGIEIDSDSDDKNSSASEETSSKKHFPQITSSKSNNCKDEGHKSKAKKQSDFRDGSKFSPKEKHQKFHTQSNSSDSNSDSELSNNENVADSKRHTHSEVDKSEKRNIQRHDSSSSSDEAEVEKKSEDVKKQGKCIKKDKTSIYTKRTVGDTFIEAQARYFQRMALKNEK